MPDRADEISDTVEESEGAARSMPLRGRVAFVTGSTRGIGLGIAEALRTAGCHVMMNGRSSGGGTAAERLARLPGAGRVAYVAADLREPVAAAALLAACEADLGAPDILVNNAGIQHVVPVEGFSDDRWDEVIGLNLAAAFRATRAALPGMRRRRWGRIVNIASVHDLVASEGKCAYVAAKHGLVSLTKTVALEAARDGITCNAICPGWVRTDLAEQQIERIADICGRFCQSPRQSDDLPGRAPLVGSGSSRGWGLGWTAARWR